MSSSPEVFSPSQQTAINALNFVVSFLALMGSTLIILVYFFIRPARSFAFRLVVYLSIADAVNELMNIMDSLVFFAAHPQNQSPLCTFEGFMREYAQLCGMLWAMVIAWILYKSMKYEYSTVERKELSLIALCTGPPLLLSLVPLTTDVYGRPDGEGSWCWIQDHIKLEWLWALLLMYIPFWAAFAFMVVCYYRVSRIVADETNEARETVSKLFYFPWISGVCYLAATVHRFYAIFFQDNIVLMILHIVISHSQGLFNALYYGFSKGSYVYALWVYVKNCGKILDPELKESFFANYDKLKEAGKNDNDDNMAKIAKTYRRISLADQDRTEILYGMS